MRYSLYFAWFVAVVSICVFTTLASLPGFTTVERPAEPALAMVAHGSRSIKIQRVRCNAQKPTCHAAKQKLQPKTPA